MSGKLLNLIKDRIRDGRPITMAEYMELCLGHPEHGYYMTRDPFGVGGDFTTAPEVSQLFGDMIGAWLADLWIKMGSPPRFTLLECGPGRGTLMADILRATKQVPGFHDAAKVTLMEMSPVLRGLQQERLASYDPYWIDDMAQLDPAIPVLLIANEFLDALPIHQLVYTNGAWMERAVAIGDSDMLVVDNISPSEDVLRTVPREILNAKEEDVFETSPCINQYIKSVSILLKKQKGAALFIDYGHVKSALGETLQAMKKHQYANIFDTPGLCDLTAHVDFENVAQIAQREGAFVHGPVTQGAFLQSLGIGLRAERLWAGANEMQRQSITSGLERLIDTQQMGSLFKVIALCGDPQLQPEGFYESL